MAGGEEMHAVPPPEAATQTAVKPENMMALLQRAQGCMDARLPEHERRVAYLVYSMAETHGGLEPMKVRELCLLALLHDIGLGLAPAEREAVFQNKRPVPTRHAVYGYFLCKEMLPGRLATAVRHHHTPYCQMEQEVQPEVNLYAQLLHLADRVSQLAGREGYTASEIDSFIKTSGADVFGNDVARLFRMADFANDICHKTQTEEYIAASKEQYFLLDAVEAGGCLQMLAYVCDIKCGHLPTATAVRVAAGKQLAAYCGLSPLCQQQVADAAMVHGFWGLTEARTAGARRALLTGMVAPEVLDMLESPTKEGKTEQDLGAGIVALAHRVSRLYDATSRPEGCKKELLRTFAQEAQVGKLPKEALRLFGQHAAEVLQAGYQAGQVALARHGNIKAGAETKNGSLWGQWPFMIE